MIEQLVALLASLGLFNQSPAGAERRCGWISNPTPANYWLSDRDGEWTIMGRGLGGNVRHDGARLGQDQRQLRLWLRLHDGAHRRADDAGDAALFGDARAAAPVPERPDTQAAELGQSTLVLPRRPERCETRR